MATLYRAYQPTRMAFLRAVDRLSARSDLQVSLFSQTSGQRGPESEPLCTDLCVVSGHPNARKLLLVTTGVHGCELFSGSAVVREFMGKVASGDEAVTGEIDVAVVHAVNPFGAAWLRRQNEHNVDLNRNFLQGIEKEAENMQTDTQFAWVRELDHKYPLLDTSNPSSHPLLLTAVALLKEGFPTLRSYFFCSNRSNPYAMNYGGATLQPEVFSLTSLLSQRLFPAQHKYKEVVHLDIHTAIGPYGESTMIVSEDQADELVKRIPGTGKNKRFLGRGGFPKVDGMLMDNLPKFLPHVGDISWRALIEEYGTYANFPVFFAQRNECIDFHRHSAWIRDFTHSLSSRMSPTYTTSDVKQAFVEAMCPHSPAWEQRIMRTGLLTIKSLLNAMQ